MLQHAGCGGHGGAAHAEHLRERFLGQGKLVGAHPVVRHQQPACAPLGDGVQSTARGVLRDLVDERLRVAQHDGAEGAAPAELFPKARRRHSEEVAGDMAESLVRRTPSAEKYRNSDHAFVAHGGDLDEAAVRHRTDD